jgi:hypothetical protein
MHARLPALTVMACLLLATPVAAATRNSASAGAQAELAVKQLRFGESRFTLSFMPSALKLTEADLTEWVLRSARAAATFFGRFPVSEVRIAIEAAAGNEVEEGVAWTDPEPRIRISVGRNTTRATLKRDTTLVHEMTHLGFPDLDDVHVWLHEGIATYVESVASAQAGEMTAAAVWTLFRKEMPTGLPERGDHGLEDTQSQDRRYWGGAMFCLMADVEIRRRTSNRLGLRDALRAILASGGNLAHTWEVERALNVGDRAVGVPVLSELFATWRSRSVTPDLEALWRELGIEPAGRSVRLDDAAPLAAIRRAITEAPKQPLLLVGPSLLYETVRAR